MDNDFVSQFQELISLEDVTYFYHVTNLNPEDILNEGLYMLGSKIYETAIEIPKEFIENPIEYAQNERGDIGYRKNASFILIGIKTEIIDELVKEAYAIPASWNCDENPEYFIAPENILGYIDTEKLELNINELADIDYCYYL